MMLARQRTVQSCLLCLCLLAGHFTPAVDAAGRSCEAVRTTFSQLEVVDENGVSSEVSGEIFAELEAVEDSSRGICKLSSSCCSSEAESTLKVATATGYHSEISEVLSQSILPAYNQSLFVTISDYIEEHRAFLVSTMLRAFSIHFRPYVNIFNDFYGYLQRTVMTGNTCEIGQKFNRVFFEVYLAAYLVGTSSTLPNSEAFRLCFYDYFLDENYDTLNNYYQAFTRSYNRTMHYLRALRTADSVLVEVLSQSLSPLCKDALMKMTYCSECAGYSSSYPCYGYCMNTMRGCLVDLSDLAGPFDEFADAVVAMKDLLEGRYDPWVQFNLLLSNFLSMASGTYNRARLIRNDVLLRCGSIGAGGSGGESKRQAPGVAPREVVEPPRAEMNQSAYALVGLKSLFKEAPEMLCALSSVEGSNQNCWNGRNIGSYGRQVLPYTRVSQIDNPEVLLCSSSTRYRGQISQLEQITRDLNILTSNYACSPDDEDCSVDLTTCDFQIPDAFDPNVETGSAQDTNGSPSTCSTCDDPCADIEDVTTTISIIAPSSTTRRVVHSTTPVRPTSTRQTSVVVVVQPTTTLDEPTRTTSTEPPDVVFEPTATPDMSQIPVTTSTEPPDVVIEPTATPDKPQVPDTTSTEPPVVVIEPTATPDKPQIPGFDDEKPTPRSGSRLQSQSVPVVLLVALSMCLYLLNLG